MTSWCYITEKKSVKTEKCVISKWNDERKQSEEQEESMKIRSAITGDLPEIRKIYNVAKAYMNKAQYTLATLSNVWSIIFATVDLSIGIEQ